MKRLIHWKYPKLTLLALAIILSYFIFRNESIGNLVFSLGSLRFIGVFIAGLLFSFGFTAPFAIGFFITYPAQNLLLASLIAGLGSTLSTLFLLKWLKLSFKDEIDNLEKTSAFKSVYRLIEHSLPHKIKIYLAYIFFGIVIATPIPNEFATFIIAGIHRVKMLIIGLLTFILSTLGIYVILLLAN
ncbi:MAG: hypothetical protein AABW80_00965 [Nanoarchaeota archaeon]